MRSISIGVLLRGGSLVSDPACRLCQVFGSALGVPPELLQREGRGLAGQAVTVLVVTHAATTKMSIAKETRMCLSCSRRASRAAKRDPRMAGTAKPRTVGHSIVKPAAWAPKPAVELITMMAREEPTACFMRS